MEEVVLSPEEILENLKTEAIALGLTFSPNIKAETLQAKIDVAKEALVAKTAPVVEPVINKTPEEIEAEDRVAMADDMLQLKRVIVTCNDTTMVNWDMTPYYSISNSLITVPSQTIPLNVEWHVPKALVQMLKAMTCYISTKSKDEKGRTITVRKEIKKYNVQDLPALTPEELDALKQAQIMRDGL